MTFVVLDRANVTSNSTGTGNITLDSAVAGYQSFANVGSNNQTYYTIASTDRSQWETGIGTIRVVTEVFPNSSYTLDRDIVISSSNNDNKVDLSEGTKYVLGSLPAAALPGVLATADDSSIGNDLSAWRNYQRFLFKGLTAGTTFINPAVSTFSIILSSTAGAYAGGVLDLNGDIHFINLGGGSVGPVQGQKLNYSTGVVSSYDLAKAGETYIGAVLAPTGDVHFIPFGAPVGQKVSVSGVVSTYTLLSSSGSNRFGGGVIDSNGNIHHIPSNIGHGQIVNPFTLESLTYALVNAPAVNSFLYRGGVLAPNGDIHFIPKRATMGQKRSAAGIVSTYSLVYTTRNAYEGGVLSVTGDVHFVPNEAIVGQKVSITGEVSTYSLVYTTASGAYSGGVLAPNGDIHFVPTSATVGQKVSAIGEVSTYSLTYTASNAYFGGVLAPDGTIYFINYTGNRGQRVHTYSEPFDIDVCTSPFSQKL